jgi:Thymidylate synthase
MSQHDPMYLDPGSIPLVREVLNRGTRAESRYGPCIEVINGRFECSSGTLITRRRINWSLGWMEFLQLVAGIWDISGIMRVAPNADHSLFTYAMSYGPRLRNQMPEIIAALRRDPDTRQAVLFIAKPEDGVSSNLPCTLTIQFLRRNDMVHGIVTMRSWDLCRGLPYDLMMFSGLLEVVSRCVGLLAGRVIVNAGSAHIYVDQLEYIPYVANQRWNFVGAPTTWKDFVLWAATNIPLLKKGGTPNNIEVTDHPVRIG